VSGKKDTRKLASSRLKNKAIDSHIRHQRFRKALIFASIMVLFVSFMSYALYMEHG